MLSPEQTELVQLIQELEPAKIQQVLEFTRKVKAEPPIDYSDDWTEEDMRDFTNASLRYLDEVYPYDWPDSEQPAEKEPPYRGIRRDLNMHEEKYDPPHRKDGK